VLTQAFIPFNNVGKRFPAKNGRELPPAIFTRWHLSGLKAPDGRRVHLKALKLGRGWFTTDAWIEEFVNDLNPQATTTPAPPTPPKRLRDSQSAARRLAAAGFSPN